MRQFGVFRPLISKNYRYIMNESDSVTHLKRRAILESMLRNRKSLALWMWVLPSTILLLVAFGCAQKEPETPGTGKSTSTARTAAGFAQFSDIAVPAGSKMDVDRSLILGARDNWIGRLAMNTSENTTKAYDFFLREMPKFGWQEITTVRSDISIIMFRRGNRIVTVQIKGQTLGGSTIDVTVSPARDSQQIPKTSMGPSQSTQ